MLKKQAHVPASGPRNLNFSPKAQEKEVAVGRPLLFIHSNHVRNRGSLHS